MTIRERRNLSGTLAWALSLAALIFVAGAAAVSLQSRPNSVVAALALLGLCAGGCGFALDARVRRARSLAMRDPLTGLPNRALFEDRLEQALRRGRRTQDPFGLIVFDLDWFKDVNDIRGHRAGDAVLKTLARRLEAVVRKSDTVARVGGDEFVVLSLETADDEQAAALVGRLRRALRRPFFVEGTTVEIDASIGWAVFPADGVTADELLAQADAQMYATKRGALDESVLLRRPVDVGIVRDVESALQRNEIAVVYQPILEVVSGEPRAAEALVRRVHPERGLLPPADFVPHVERTPLARELTLLVTADALNSARMWSEEGYDLGVSVNVPYRLLDDPQFAEGLAGLLRSSEVSAERLTLEVVPGRGAGAELDEHVIRLFSRLGVRLSLDDVGRAASFVALRVLPLDEVKIDGAFVHGVAVNQTDAALVRGMIEIGHALDMTVVAEGVETREAWNELAGWGCDLAQGYLVSVPMPATDLTGWLGDRWPAVA